MNIAARISPGLQRFAGSRAALTVTFTWAFAEALVWPIIPDAWLAVLATARPRRWGALAAVAVIGSVLGGAVGVAATADGWSWPLWLTTPRMAGAVAGWLAVGADGLSHQPLSGVPYKVFVAHSAEAGIAPLPFAIATLRYRAPRLVVVTLISAAVAALLWRFVPQRRQARVHVALTTAAVVALVVGLAGVIARWS